jgi:uncharacterized protein involved in outer membrane biogenesis
MKIFIKSFISLFIVIILAAGVIAFIGWARVPDMLSKNLSKKMKVPVEIEEMDLSFNTIEVIKLEIGNPKDSILPRAFSSESIKIHAPLTEYLHDHIVIETINVDDIYLGLEFNTPRSTEGNWTTIMNNFKNSSEAESSSSSSKKTVLIKKLVLTNISVELVYKEGDKKVKKLKPIARLEFTNVTSEGGIPTEQLMKTVLGQMLKSVFEQENLKDMLNGILKPQDQIQKLVPTPLQKLLPF